MTNAPADWPPAAALFMKIGVHGSESLDDILARKAREYETSGRILWGYGGTVLHPATQVQPFAAECTKRLGSVYVLMERLPKPRRYHIPNTDTATHYSANGTDWERLPESVQTGPAYALVLDEIIPVNREIDLRDYRVGIGHNKGRNATDYIRWRVDKGCLVYAGPMPDHPPAEQPVSIAYAARLLDPYAVFLRHD